MSASNKTRLPTGGFFALLSAAAIAFWYYAPPKVHVSYSKDGTKNINYILNTQDKIVKGELIRGKSTGDVGHIFPNDEFFMELYWWREKERRHCVSIMPKWPDTHIYLDADGNVDTSERSGTDVDRLKRCEWDTAKP